MILYLVRHGETVTNKSGLIQGQRDVELSDKGIEDAKELKDLIKSLDIDVVISSPLKRAIDTAKIITDNKYPINIDDRIIERDWGLIEGIKFTEVDSYKNWHFSENTGNDQIEKVNDFTIFLRREVLIGAFFPSKLPICAKQFANQYCAKNSKFYHAPVRNRKSNTGCTESNQQAFALSQRSYLALY